MPIISNVSEKPGVDERGIWIEMDFEYHGTVQMTLQTKLNLMKLKKGDDETVRIILYYHHEFKNTRIRKYSGRLFD